MISINGVVIATPKSPLPKLSFELLVSTCIASLNAEPMIPFNVSIHSVLCSSGTIASFPASPNTPSVALSTTPPLARLIAVLVT